MKATKIVVILALALAPASEVANADFVFGEPVNLGPTINSSAKDFKPNISVDGLTLFFISTRPGGYGGRDIWVTMRDTIDDKWGTPINLGSPINTSSRDSGPSISADRLSLFFDSGRSGGYGGDDLWVSTRPTLSDPWGEPMNLGATVNSSYAERAPSISDDGLELFFHSDRPSVSGGYGMHDLWVTTRKTTNDPWGPPANLGLTANSGTFDGAPSISSDGLSLFFMSARYSKFSDLDIWVTRRATINDTWREPVNLGPNVNSTDDDWGPSISADALLLFFGSDRPGGFGDLDMWQVSITPVVDFNGDEIVDSADICIMVDHWGENYPLCDIGPSPLGDGIVDVQDLIVLAEHLFEDYRLIGYWMLDETKGSIAADSAGDNDATLHGEPLWQPEAGMVSGALELDGIDDYVSTPFVLKPGTTQFSVFAWIKGGAPGQMIISQTGGSMFFGATWLGTDPSYGKFMTKLPDPQSPLQSDFVITDGQWHHIGLVWDRFLKHLYVDGEEVVKDFTMIVEVPSDGGLYIGAAKDLDAGSFWSGLIDDVRIYDVALTPEEIEAFVQ